MGEWKEYKLDDLFGRIIRKNIDLESNNVLTISAQHGLINQEEFFNKSVAGKNLKNYYLLKKGEFAYNKSYSAGYPMGATKILEKYDEGIVSTLYICFKSKSQLVYNKYFKYFFESKEYYDELTQIVQEGARNHGLLNVSVKDFFNIKVKLPTLKEQEKIVNILEKVDLIIEKYEKLLAEKDQFIKSQFVEMFIKTNYPRITLNEISSVKGEYGLSVSSKSYDESLGRYIRITDINDDGTLNTDCTSPMTDKNIENYILKEGDILFARTGGTVGKTYKYRLSDGKCSYAGYCIRFRIVSDKTNVDYIYAYTKTNEYKNWIKDRQRVGAQPNINSNEYGNELKIPLPPKEKQKEFIELNQLIDKQKFELEKQKQNYIKLKKGLMQQLLTGKVRINA